jgi:hypothetical protein
MRKLGTITLILALAASTAAAQPWLEYVSREHRFSVNFPIEPTIREDTYATSEGSVARAHVFSVERNGGYYIVTVVRLPPSANNLQAEMDHAAALLRQTGKVSVDSTNLVDGIASRDINLTQADGRQVVATILAYDGRLYIVEGTAPAGAVPPIQFAQSIGVVDTNGNPVSVVE